MEGRANNQPIGRGGCFKFLNRTPQPIVVVLWVKGPDVTSNTKKQLQVCCFSFSFRYAVQSLLMQFSLFLLQQMLTGHWFDFLPNVKRRFFCVFLWIAVISLFPIQWLKRYMPINQYANISLTIVMACYGMRMFSIPQLNKLIVVDLNGRTLQNLNTLYARSFDFFVKILGILNLHF